MEGSRSLRVVKLHILRQHSMCLAALFIMVRPMLSSFTRWSFNDIFTFPSPFPLFSLENTFYPCKNSKKCGHLLILSNLFFIFFYYVKFDLFISQFHLLVFDFYIKFGPHFFFIFFLLFFSI